MRDIAWDLRAANASGLPVYENYDGPQERRNFEFTVPFL